MELTKKNIQVVSSSGDLQIKMSAIKVCVLCYKLAQQYLLYKIEWHSSEPIQALPSSAYHPPLATRTSVQGLCVVMSASVIRQGRLCNLYVPVTSFQAVMQLSKCAGLLVHFV